VGRCAAISSAAVAETVSWKQLAIWITRLYVVDVYVLRQLYWFLAEITDESVLPYVLDYLPTLLLIISAVKDFLFCFSFGIRVTL
jgi:hypothetical protein